MNWPLQCRLDTLLLAMAVMGTSLALAGGWGILLGGYCLLLVYAIRGAFNLRPGGCGILMAVLIVGLTSLCIVSAGWFRREGQRRVTCGSHLKQLALALEAYRGRWGSYPPPYLAAPDGKPMHSWRVLVLPHLQQNGLWDSYRLDEPWDGPNNRQLATPPAPYCCPSDNSVGRSAETNYLMVTGPGTASEALANCGAKGLPPCKRILLVEVLHSGIDWKEPKDLTLDEALAGVNSGRSRGISSLHIGRRGAYVALADGPVRYVPETVSREDLEALLTGDLGNDTVDAILATPADDSAGLPDPGAIAWLVSFLILLAHGLVLDALRAEKHPSRRSGALSEARLNTEGK